MGIKKYVFFSLIFIVAVLGYLLYIQAGDYKFEIFDYSLELPIAIWVILPVAVLFVATLFHLVFYSVKFYILKTSIKNDKIKLIDLIQKKLCGCEFNKQFTTSEFKDLADILIKLSIIDGKEKPVFADENITKLITTIKEIKDGKYKDIKEFSLDKDCEIVMLNSLNKAQNDETYALNIIKKSQNHDELLIKIAFKSLLSKNKIGDIKPYLANITLSNDMFLELISANAKENKELIFSNEEILTMCKSLDLNRNDYLKIARSYIKTMSPEQLSNLYEQFYTIDEDSSDGYLYVLFELGMLDDVREILSNSKKDEYTRFKVLMQLKEAGKYYNYDSLF